MSREERLDQRRVAAGRLLEDLEHLHHAPAVPPGAAHQRHPHAIGLAFVFAAEFQCCAAREKFGGDLRTTCPAGITKQ